MGANPDNSACRAKDSLWVAMIGIDLHLRDMLLSFFHCANSAKAIHAAVERDTAQEIEEDASRIGLPLGIVRAHEEWAAHPQGIATVERPLIDFEVTKTEKRRVLGAAKYRPLEGARVVELTHMVAGPAICLARLGTVGDLPRRPKRPKPCVCRRTLAASGGRCDMSDDEWKKSLPFKRHWALYLFFKLLVLALAGLAAWRLLQALAVV